MPTVFRCARSAKNGTVTGSAREARAAGRLVSFTRARAPDQTASPDGSPTGVRRDHNREAAHPPPSQTPSGGSRVCGDSRANADPSRQAEAVQLRIDVTVLGTGGNANDLPLGASDQMNTQPELDEQSPAVRTHLELLQGAIERMAVNSRSCKVWCVTVAAAVLVLVARTGEAQHALIALVPAALFFVLDAYYLALEQAFIASYSSFVARVHERALTLSDLYAIAPEGSVRGRTLRCLLSFSILPFYALMVVTILLAWWVIL